MVYRIDFIWFAKALKTRSIESSNQDNQLVFTWSFVYYFYTVTNPSIFDQYNNSHYTYNCWVENKYLWYERLYKTNAYFVIFEENRIFWSHLFCYFWCLSMIRNRNNTRSLVSLSTRNGLHMSRNKIFLICCNIYLSLYFLRIRNYDL